MGFGGGGEGAEDGELGGRGEPDLDLDRGVDADLDCARDIGAGLLLSSLYPASTRLSSSLLYLRAGRSASLGGEREAEADRFRGGAPALSSSSSSLLRFGERSRESSMVVLDEVAEVQSNNTRALTRSCIHCRTSASIAARAQAVNDPCRSTSTLVRRHEQIIYKPAPSMETTANSPPPSRLRILTLNCWGLKFISTLRRERLSEIGHQIAQADPAPDIVGLQECWTQEDYNAIRDSTRHILPYGKFYWSGIFGGGLAILSRWPIEESNMFRYPLNGRPAAFYRGDWYVGKGVACARIRMGPTRRDVAEVFCTHVTSPKNTLGATLTNPQLHAPYEAEPFDSYMCHRTAQAWEITKLMRGAAERGHLVIGLGDFNMVPLSLAHRIIETHSPVRDVWRIMYPDSSIGAAKDKAEQLRGLPMPTAEYNLTVNGATCDSALNSWRWNKADKKRLDRGENVVIEASVQDPKAKRLDYIFFSSGSHHDASSGTATPEWTLESANVGMTMRHPTLHCSLSDHFSVEATLIRNAAKSTSIERSPYALPETYLPIGIYDDILAKITKYTERERTQRRLRLGHFGYQLLLTVGCLVGVWWSPHNYVSFILMLLSSIGLSVGVLEGLMGGLFVGSELRALKEFEWEVQNTRARALASGRLDEELLV